MVSAERLPFFFPRSTWIHRLHFLTRLGICLFYAVLIFLLPGELHLALILLFLWSLTVATALPVPGGAWLVAAAVTLIGLALVASSTWWSDILIGLCRVLGLSFLVSILAMTTRMDDILRLFQFSARFTRRLQPVLFILYTALVVFPSIQYDLSRSMDAEHIRRQCPLRFYHFSGWITVLSVLVVRLMNRAERFTDTILERGYLPGCEIYPLEPRRLTQVDVILPILVLLPGLLVGGWAL